MAVIRGTIRSAGAGVPGLTVKAFEQVQNGIELDNKPCRLSNPSILQVGTVTTDADGRFRVQYDAREPLSIACAFVAQVKVVVFDQGTLVWSSPQRTRQSINTFDHDILPAVEPDPEPAARIRGRLTTCGRAASGFRVLAFEIVAQGFPTDIKPCQISTTTRQVGSAVVEADGAWSIGFTPRAPVPDGCFFSSQVRVEAFEGAQRVWRSPTRPSNLSLRFDHELKQDCIEGSTGVRVVNEFGARVPGAEVFVNGRSQAVTDSVGEAFLTEIAAGDLLVARLRLDESSSPRADHSDDSDRNWNYRVYITSMTLRHDENGDDPTFEQHDVVDPGALQVLTLSRRNTVVGFNLTASVEWHATREEITYYRDRFIDTSEIMFNATDGQFLIERISISDAKREWDSADYRIYANRNQPSNANLGAIRSSSGRVRMNPYDARYPGTLLHEFGHYGLELRDEYKAADCWPEGEPVACTLKKFEAGTKFSENGTKDSCVMRGNRMRNRKKICSAHRDNPHANCTQQGSVDCWTTIVQHYSNFPQWRILSPTSRRAIIDRLPDTGLSTGASTPPPSDADDPESFIPLADWKPRWHLSRRVRPDPCPDLVVRTHVGGQPENGVLVMLRTSEGDNLEQGRTKALSLADATPNGVGEIIVRGAAVGDSILAAKVIGGRFHFGTATIESCSSPLEVTLARRFPLFGFTGKSVDESGIELAVAFAGGVAKNIPPPSVLMERDGEEGASSLDVAPPTGAAVRSLCIPVPDAESSFILDSFLFDEEGSASLLRSEVAIATPSASEESIVKSANGEVELVLPEGSLPAGGRVTILRDPGLPQPELGDGDLLLIPPHQILSSQGGRLYHPVLLHLQVGAAYADPTLAENPGNVELLHWGEAESRWCALKRTLNLDPFVASATLREFGIVALVLRAVSY
jgi:hypothetical protein